MSGWRVAKARGSPAWRGRGRPTRSTLWRAIEQAGGIQAYVDAQLAERGFLVERRETDEMSDREREAYKKSLKAEAEERRRLAREAWQAYKASHIVHLGEGVFWNDDAGARQVGPAQRRGARRRERAAAARLAAAAGRGARPDHRRAPLAGLPPRRGDDASTTAASPSPSATAPSGPIWAPMPKLKAAQRWILRNIVEKLPVHGVGPRLPARPLDPHQRRGARRTRRSC